VRTRDEDIKRLEIQESERINYGWSPDDLLKLALSQLAYEAAKWLANHRRTR